MCGGVGADLVSIYKSTTIRRATKWNCCVDLASHTGVPEVSRLLKDAVSCESNHLKRGLGGRALDSCDGHLGDFLKLPFPPGILVVLQQRHHVQGLDLPFITHWLSGH